MRFKKHPRLHPLLLFLILGLLLAASAFPASAEDASAPLVECNGKVWYTVQDGERVMQTMIARLDTDARAGADPAELRDEVIRTLEQQVVLNLKYEELGLNNITTEEQLLLEANTQKAYDEAVAQTAAQLREGYGGTEENALVTAKALLEQTGLTYEAVSQQILAQWRSLRLANAVVGDVTVSDEEIDEAYRQQIVEPDRLKYEGKIAEYEEDVLFGGGHSAYIPGEYKLVQWILLAPQDEVLAERLKTAIGAKDAAYEQAADAFAATYGTFDSEEQLNTVRETYSAALALYDQKLSALEEVRQELLDSESERISGILEEANSGVSWDELIRQYSADLSTVGNPYPVNPGSAITDPILIETAEALKTPGQVCDPAVTDSGILLVTLVRIIPEGAAEMQEEDRQKLREQLTDFEKAEKLLDIAKGWRDNYAIQSWTDRLDVPVLP